MGARLVAEVLANFNDVGHDPFRLLVRMAHSALDEASRNRPARVYFGGRDLLALTLSRDLPTCPERERGSHKEWRGARANVKKALRVLVAAGAIERDGVAHTGENQLYRLSLKRAVGFEPARKGGPRTARKEGSSTDSPQGSSTDSPVEKEGSSTDSLEGSSTDSPKEPRRNQGQPERYQEPAGKRRLLRSRIARDAPVIRNPDTGEWEESPNAALRVVR